MKKFDFDKLVSSDVSKLLGNAMESYAKLSEEQDDVVFFTLKLHNTTRKSKLEVSGQIDKALQEQILKLLRVT